MQQRMKTFRSHPNQLEMSQAPSANADANADEIGAASQDGNGRAALAASLRTHRDGVGVVAGRLPFLLSITPRFSKVLCQEGGPFSICFGIRLNTPILGFSLFPSLC